MSVSKNITVHNVNQWAEFVEDVKSPSHKKFSMLKPGKYHTGIRIRDIISMVCQGLIVGYETSRGDGNVDPGHVATIMSDFNPFYVGEILLTTNDERGIMECYDGNQRVTGLLQGFKAGKLAPEILDSDITVLVVPYSERINGYVKKGQQHGHYSAGHYANSEFVYGSIIKKEIFPCLSDEDRKMLNNKAYFPPLAYLVYVLNEQRKTGYEVECYQQLYQIRGIVKGKATLTKEQAHISLSEVDKHRVIVGLQYWCDYVRALEDKAKLTLEQFKLAEVSDGGLKKHLSAFKKSSWFGAVITDQIFNKETGQRTTKYRLTTTRPQTLADRSIRKHSELRDLIPRVTGSTYASVARSLEDIGRTFAINNP